MLKKVILTLVMLGFVATPAIADTLIMEGIDSAAAEHPQRGVSKTEVEQNYGEPVTSRSAVGDPPISSWEYGQFVVYFEYDRVLHTIAKR